MRKVHRFILVTLWLFSVCIPTGMALANEEPYVLIQNAAESLPGRTMYGLSFGYVPHASSGQAWDPQGQPYMLNILVREWSLRGTARKDWSDRWTFTAGSRYNRLSVVEERIYPTHQEEIQAIESTWGIQLGLQGKLKPGHPLEPKFGLAIALPEQMVEAQLGLSMVRDPMVLSGTLGYGKDLNDLGDNLAAGFGVGFVANDVISISVSAQHLMTLGTWAPPTNRFSIAVGYLVDRTVGQQVNFETAFWSDGERFVVSFGMGWTTQGS